MSTSAVKMKSLLFSRFHPSFTLLGSCTMTTITGDIRAAHNEFFGKYLSDTYYMFAREQAGRNGNYVENFSPNVSRTSIEDSKPCTMLWNRLHITCEGYLTCCCVDYEHDLVYADLNKDSFKDSWNNDLIVKLRSRMVEKELKGTICYSCLTGERDEYEPISNISKREKINPRSKDIKLEKYLERIKSVKNDN